MTLTSASELATELASAAGWTAVCVLAQLEPLWGEAALVDGDQVALFLIPDGSIYAIGNEDPATGAYVMSRGIVGSRGSRHTIASPLHKQVYDLRTGECFTSAEYALVMWDARVVGDVIEVCRRRVSATSQSPGDAVSTS